MYLYLLHRYLTQKMDQDRANDKISNLMTMLNFLRNSKSATKTIITYHGGFASDLVKETFQD